MCGGALLKIYETLDEESKREAYNFVAYIMYKRNKKKSVILFAPDSARLGWTRQHKKIHCSIVSFNFLC